MFGDFITGRLWHIAADQAPTRVMTADDGSATGLAIASFAEDATGELYIVDYGGTLHRVRARELTARRTRVDAAGMRWLHAADPGPFPELGKAAHALGERPRINRLRDTAPERLQSARQGH